MVCRAMWIGEFILSLTLEMEARPAPQAKAQIESRIRDFKSCQVGDNPGFVSNSKGQHVALHFKSNLPTKIATVYLLQQLLLRHKLLWMIYRKIDSVSG